MVLGIWYFVVYLVFFLILIVFKKSKDFVINNKGEIITATSAYVYTLADIKSESFEDFLPDYSWKSCDNYLIALGVATFIVGQYLGYQKNRHLATLQQTKKDLAALQHTHQKIQDEYYALCSDYIKIIFEPFFSANAHTHARVSIYKHRGAHFTLLGRCSDNPKYNKKGLQTYTDDEGFIALGWQQGTFAIHGIPEWQHKGATYMKYMKGKCQINEERLKKLTMHSRSFYVLRLNNPDGAQPHGIIVFETLSDAPIEVASIEAVFNQHHKQIIAFIKTMRTIA